jgi:hypothetical protein
VFWRRDRPNNPVGHSALYEVKESEDADEARSAVKEKRKAIYKGR